MYEDFMNYKSGIYKYSSGLALGGHAGAFTLPTVAAMLPLAVCTLWLRRASCLSVTSGQISCAAAGCLLYSLWAHLPFECLLPAAQSLISGGRSQNCWLGSRPSTG